MAKTIEDLLNGNQHFVDTFLKDDPDFFKESAKGQQPEFLWIGCSDSRVPESKVTDSDPGRLFVHRNIANVVVRTDANLLSVAYYAIRVLKVKHVIICGHYGCGGVQAAMSHNKFGYIDSWLGHIKDVYRINEAELSAIPKEEDRFKRLVELNVAEQVKHMATIPFVQESWEDGEFPYIHGWVYDLHTGLIKDLGISVNSTAQVSEIYSYK